MDEMETPLTMHERGVSGKPTAFNKTQSKEGQEKTDGQKRIAEGLQRIFDSRASRTIGQNIWRSEGGIESPPRNDDRNIDLGERLRSNTGSSDRGEIEAGNLRELHGSRLKAHQELRAQDTMIQSTGGASAYEKLAKDKAVSIERQVYRLQAKAETLLTKARKDEQQLRANPPSRVKAFLIPKVKINWQKRIEQAKRRADRAEKTIKGCDTLKWNTVRMKVKIDNAIARSATPEMLAEHRRIEEERKKALAEKRRQEEAKRLEQTKDMMRRLEAERTRGKQQGNILGIGRERQI